MKQAPTGMSEFQQSGTYRVQAGTESHFPLHRLSKSLRKSTRLATSTGRINESSSPYVIWDDLAPKAILEKLFSQFSQNEAHTSPSRTVIHFVIVPTLVIKIALCLQYYVWSICEDLAISEIKRELAV